MKAAVITRYGDPSALEIAEVPIPDVATDEALIAVVASTINPVDVKTRTPGTPQRVGRFPAVLGWDVAGIVISAPAQSGWMPGDRVIALNPPRPNGEGSWQQYAAIPVSLLAPAPVSVDLPTAATLPLAALTADQALARLELRDGERLLVTGAAGSVGGMAIQLAVRAGVRVSALVSREAHERECLALGAEAAFSDPARVGEFDAILDTAGVLDHPRLLGMGGRVITVSDEPIPERFRLHAPSAARSYVQHDPQRLGQLSALVDAGAITLRIDDYHALGNIERAHRRMEGRGVLGKTVLVL